MTYSLSALLFITSANGSESVTEHLEVSLATFPFLDAEIVHANNMVKKRSSHFAQVVDLSVQGLADIEDTTSQSLGNELASGRRTEELERVSRPRTILEGTVMSMLFNLMNFLISSMQPSSSMLAIVVAN